LHRITIFYINRYSKAQAKAWIIHTIGIDKGCVKAKKKKQVQKLKCLPHVYPEKKDK
jgi:hypothetical protein